VNCGPRSTPVYLRLIPFQSTVHSSRLQNRIKYIPVHGSLQLRPTPVHSPRTIQFQSTVLSSLQSTFHFSLFRSKVHSGLSSTPIHGILQSTVRSMIHSISHSNPVHFSQLSTVHSCPRFGSMVYSGHLQLTRVHPGPQWSSTVHIPVHDAIQAMVNSGPW